MIKFIYLIIIQFIIISIALSSSNIAICITGNIRRLELVSKIVNVIIPNIITGNSIDIFLYLESRNTDSQFTIGADSYNNSLYEDFEEADLSKFIRRSVTQILKKRKYESSLINQINLKLGIFVKLYTPQQVHFSYVNNKLPMTAGWKDRNASVLFQSVFRMFNGVRQCAIWTQQIEYKKKSFYEFFIRLREDSYAISPWIFNDSSWKNSITFTDHAGFGGFCDRWFVCDRQYVDSFVRGLVEHYYLNNFLIGDSFPSSEYILLYLINSLDIPYNLATFCEIPLITIRNIYKRNFWLTDEATIDPFIPELVNISSTDPRYPTYQEFLQKLSCLDKLQSSWRKINYPTTPKYVVSVLPLEKGLS